MNGGIDPRPGGQGREGRPRRPRAVVGAAAAVLAMVALPAAAFLLAPSAHADDSPGANLAGVDASAFATAVQVSPLTPGVVGAGNVSRGNLVEADIPYSSSSTSTGPSSSSVASPAYPGDTAAGAGNAIATFAPQFPPQLVGMLNYPVVAQADYPAQVSVGSSSSYSPPGGSAAGVGTASANAADTGATGQAATSQTSFAAAGITVASSTATSKTVLGASSVSASSHTDVGTIQLLGGAVTIAGITSDAGATSDGNVGNPTNDFRLGAVTVGGVPASIGPTGITLGPASQGSLLAPAANQALTALEQAGISVHTISPVTTSNGASATVTSGALVIQFQDPNIPNPNGQVPLSSIGLDLNLGLSEASADATTLPPFDTSAFPGGTDSTGLPTGTGAPAADLGSGSAPVASAALGASGPTDQSGASAALPSMAEPVSAAPSTATRSSGGAPPGAAPSVAQPMTLLGAPVKVAWVVIAFLLSLVVAGPLLGYANWQLLRGRRS